MVCTIACIRASKVASGQSVFPPRFAASTSFLNCSAVKLDKSVYDERINKVNMSFLLQRFSKCLKWFQ